MVRRLSWLAIVGLLAAGCSSGSEAPRVLPPVATPSATTASPTASPLPSGADAATPQGATAFARLWYSEITRAWEEQDPAIIERLSAPGCTACKRYVESITGVRQRGERVDDVVFRLKLVEATAVRDGKSIVAIVYDSPKSTRYDRAGKALDTEPAVSNYEEELTLVRAGASWLVQKDSAT